MHNTAERLDLLLSKVRALPEAQQHAAIAALEEITAAPYILSDLEMAILTPALADVARGENIIDAQDEALLVQPWD
jgi:hypothetical protein